MSKQLSSLTVIHNKKKKRVLTAQKNGSCSKRKKNRIHLDFETLLDMEFFHHQYRQSFLTVILILEKLPKY